MYVKCGNCVDARKVFDEMTERDVSSWNTMIAAYRRRGHPRQALALFHQMQQTGLQPDQFTFSSIFQACAKLRALEQGMDSHQGIVERGFLSDVVIVNTLIDMYAKCGSVHKARELFDKMPQRSVISWNSMIAGYAQNGVLDKALRLFDEMPEKNVVSWNAMIAGCVQNGDVDLALRFFKEMPRPDVISWNAMVAGYARDGLVEKALETFKQIRLVGLKPNSSTFAIILPACAKRGALEQGIDIHQGIIECGFMSDVVVVSALVDMYAKCGSIQKARELHAGLVDQGCKYFNDMTATYCITPMIDHYVCLVDLLGRAGYLEEGLNIIIKMPIKPMVVVWICLLGACRSHKSVELGVFAANLLFELDPINAATYVPLSNIYAELGRVKIKVGALMEILETENVDPYLPILQLVERGRATDRVLDLNIPVQDEAMGWTTSFLPAFDAPVIQTQEDAAMDE
ncbi:pentatricopeptide repeat-containing protein At5g59600 [Cryptomeria japonica]|uniref:pentatricopeptide repeat-containing protein At5g59600 n=1 Tax=Cryptomeria japonica TaxID=3369 RepID=UPI0027DA6089|nr:pentatricopeptide repeat-containing protein At5g59600 [Cryptomeria japonica]